MPARLLSIPAVAAALDIGRDRHPAWLISGEPSALHADDHQA
ncbi:hypothetical protein ACQEVF_52625 [Nonomuraea polychroma]